MIVLFNFYRERAQKHGRCLNYSPEEKLLLLNLCEKYKHVIEYKKTDATSWKQKEDTWFKIWNEYNANSTVHRDKDSLKKCYNNQKRSTRKVMAKNKQDVYQTGGGLNKAPLVSPVDEATLLVMNKTTVNGLNNNYDDDRIKEIINEDDVVCTKEIDVSYIEEIEVTFAVSINK